MARGNQSASCSPECGFLRVRACFQAGAFSSFRMSLPEQPVTLTVEQIVSLNRALGEMRHDISNNLMLVLAAVELIRAKPELTERMIGTLLEQPAKVTRAMQK